MCTGRSWLLLWHVSVFVSVKKIGAAQPEAFKYYTKRNSRILKVCVTLMSLCVTVLISFGGHSISFLFFWFLNLILIFFIQLFIGRFRQFAHALLWQHWRLRRLFQRRITRFIRQRRFKVRECKKWYFSSWKKRGRKERKFPIRMCHAIVVVVVVVDVQLPPLQYHLYPVLVTVLLCLSVMLLPARWE